jgi:hypothetical protein
MTEDQRRYLEKQHTREHRQEMWVGEFLITLSSHLPGHVLISHRSGEGGTYRIDQLETAIKQFVMSNF